MDRKTLRHFILALSVVSLIPAVIHSKPKKPPPGNTMTFTPEDTGQTPAPEDTPATPPPEAPKKKARAAAVQQASDDKASAGPASKVLERALKLY